MQIKGYKYRVSYLEDSTVLPLKGYLYYNKEHLYSNNNAIWKQNNIQTSSLDITIDSNKTGTYFYEIIPFTQYGYEESLKKTGTFEVVNNFVSPDSQLTVNEYYWDYDSPNSQIELNADVTISLT
jgi:hypothetical protein